MHTADQLMQAHVPAIVKKMEEIGMPLLLANTTSQCFMTGFLYNLPFTMAVRIWDSFWLRKFDFFYMVAVSLFKISKHSVLKMEMEDIVMWLKFKDNNEGLGFDIDQLLDTSVSLYNKVKASRLRKWEDEIKDQEPPPIPSQETQTPSPTPTPEKSPREVNTPIPPNKSPRDVPIESEDSHQETQEESPRPIDKSPRELAPMIRKSPREAPAPPPREKIVESQVQRDSSLIAQELSQSLPTYVAREVSSPERSPRDEEELETTTEDPENESRLAPQSSRNSDHEGFSRSRRVTPIKRISMSNVQEEERKQKRWQARKERLQRHVRGPSSSVEVAE